MGISNDIRPKKKKIEKPEPTPDLPKGEEKIELEEGEEEVSIKRTSASDNFSVHHAPHSESVDDFFGPFVQHPEEYPKEEENPVSEAKRSRSGTWSKILIILLTLSLIAILIKQNLDAIYKYLGVDELIGTTKTTDTVTNPYENLNTDYTSPTVESDTSTTAVDNPNSTTGGAATQTPVISAPTLNKSTVKISVLNGNGVSGSAATVKNALETSGYTVSNVSNAKLFSYQSTIVYYKTGKKDFAEDIKTVLNNRTVEMEESNSIAGTFDLVVVVGAK